MAQSEMGIDWMSVLQSLPLQKHGHLCAILNPFFLPYPTHVPGHYAYPHPILFADSVRAQWLLARFNKQAATLATGRRQFPLYGGLRVHSSIKGIIVRILYMKVSSGTQIARSARGQRHSAADPPRLVVLAMTATSPMPVPRFLRWVVTDGQKGDDGN